ncbi:MAG: DegT/DnrJ/EryC1/StrS family aminotransferase [Verrucomicrobiaceae bacterium]|nr:DegT/DnrJ/EryC1/StrS family aminotransferase [Verrucomicrobiaceae bacterium]
MERVMRSGSYILGEEVSAFETEFAASLGVRHAVAVASGTDAIEVMLRGHGIGAGDKVVAPAFAPSAVAAGILRSGAELLLADVEEEMFTLCPESLEAVLSSPAGRDVKAVLAVHLYGQPAAWDQLQKVTAAHGVLLLEDCAQSHGAFWQGRPTGTLGSSAAFSFYPTKNLAALGDAGAVVTGDDELAGRLRQVRQYGWHERHVSECDGVNSRMDELQAAVLRVKLPGLTENVSRRRQIATHYVLRLRSCRALRLPVTRSRCEHAFHQFVVRSSRRDALLQHLHARGIPATVHYPVALHQQAAFRSNGSFPASEKLAAEVLSLPLHPWLKAEAIPTVCEALEAFNHG